MTNIRGGIIAAGHGERLKGARWPMPKPLIPVAGRPLIAHAIDNLRHAGIDEITILFNMKVAACAEWIRSNMHGVGIEVLSRDTASSFESFCHIAAHLHGVPAIVTTVDCIMVDPGLMPAADALALLPADGLLLGLTANCDDENPLWVDYDPTTKRVCRIGGATGNAVTAGVYGLPAAFVAPRGYELPRLRDYLAQYATSGRPVIGVMLGDVVDVDRPCDVQAAERRISGRVG